MNRLKFSIYIIVLLLGGSFSAWSQESTGTALPANWTLQNCIDYAKKNNIQVNTLKLNGENARQQLLLSKAAVLPDVYGSASQSLSHYNQNASANTIGATGNAGLNSLWTLYNGGYLRNDIKQKDLSVEAANLNVLASENDITLQITRAYLNVLVDKENIIYNQDLVKTSKAQLDQARQRYKAGSIARKDVVQFEAQLATDQYSLSAAQNAERQDKLSLKQLLQIPVTPQEFDIVKPDTMIAAAAVAPLKQVQDYALKNRPEIKSSELELQVSEYDLKKAQAGYKPVLSASGGIGTSYTNNAEYSTIRQFDNNFYQQVGLTLSIPVFTKRVNKTNVQVAKINIDQARLDLQNTRTTLNLDIEQAYINVVNAQAQYDAAVEQLRYNEEIYRIANNELEVGAANVFTFYQQRNLYVQALQSYIEAKYNAALSVKIYDFYAGNPVKL